MKSRKILQRGYGKTGAVLPEQIGKILPSLVTEWYQIQLMLDHDSRWETEEFLHKHQCYLHYDEADFRRDGEVLKEILGKGLQ
jgi:hypothetical protein